MNSTLDTTEDLQARLRALTDRSLSPTGRYAHVGLLLSATAAGALVLALLLTEPALPPRTQFAFGAMLLIAASWIGYSAWVLTHRRPLLLRHRVVAGGLATAFSGAFAAVTSAAALATGTASARAAAALGVLMLVTAVALLLRARSKRAELEARRAALQRQLDGRG